MPQSNVVITGVGVVSSIGIGGEAFFQALLDKRSGITSLANRTDLGPKPNPDSQPAGLWIGGPVTDFNPKEYVKPRKALKVMCREIQMAFAASQMAIQQAGLDTVLPAAEDGSITPDTIGTVFGSEMYYGSPGEMEDAVRGCMDEDGEIIGSRFGQAAMKNVMPLWMLKYLPNMPACHVGISINAQGPNNTLVLGDVSGPAAVTESVSCLQRGNTRVMLAGASGTRIGTTRLNYSIDIPIGEMYDPVERSSRPFDPLSRGVIGGEAAATVVLETSGEVAKRNGTPLARVASYASRFVPSKNMTNRPRSVALDATESRASRAAMELAIEAAIQDANIDVKSIGLIVSHAMGDPVVDQQEIAAIEKTIPGVPVTATIASLGHTGAASGMIDIATGALAIMNRTVPPTLMTETSDTTVGLLDEAKPLEGDCVLVLSHTSNGNATAIILSNP
ncbi:MAG: beta-ketoacyl synthase N-terminal-like domain-containing protein [Planctomycetota bacterium]